MSELYDLSLDELLKGDATLLNKIERDMKVPKPKITLSNLCGNGPIHI